MKLKLIHNKYVCYGNHPDELRDADEYIDTAADPEIDICIHVEHDHGFCLDCNEDISDILQDKAERLYEGDR